MVEIPIINVEVPKPENLVWGDKYDKKKDKKKIYKILAYLAVIAALIIFFRFAILAYLYIANLPKINSYDASIERIALTDDGKQAYIKLTGGNSKEIDSIKFVFRSNESEFVYETKDGIGEISYEETNSFLSYFAHPEYEGSYDYTIRAGDIGLDDFRGIVKVEVVIRYKDENTGEVKETKIIDSTKKSDINVVRSGGYSGGGGGSGGSGSSGGGSGTSGNNGNNGGIIGGNFGSCSNDIDCKNLSGVCGVGRCNLDSKTCYIFYNSTFDICRESINECDKKDYCNKQSLDCIDNKKDNGEDCSIGSCSNGNCKIYTTYYVDATNGNDLNNGLTPESAWKGKGLDTYLKPGDRVLLKRGEVWKGQIYVRSSGNSSDQIVYGAYGVGPKPIITKIDSVSNWSNPNSWINLGFSEANSFNWVRESSNNNTDIMNSRSIIPADYFSIDSNSFRIKIGGHLREPVMISSAYIGEQSLSGDPYDMIPGTIKQFLFNGNSFLNLEINGSQYSDWLMIPFNHSKNYIISLGINSSAKGMYGITTEYQERSYYKYRVLNDSGTPDVSGYNTLIAYWGLAGYEINGSGGSNVWYINYGSQDPERIWLSGKESGVVEKIPRLNEKYSWMYQPSNQRLYIYSVGNPALTFSNIEVSGKSGFIVYCNEKDYLTFRDLDVRGGYRSSVSIDGCSNIIIENNNIGYGSGTTGVSVGYSSNGRDSANGIIRNNIVDSGNRVKNYWHAETSDDGISLRGNNWKVYNNSVIGWAHTGISLENFNSDSSVSNNKVYDNIISCPDIEYGRGFASISNGPYENNEFYNNIIYNTKTRSQIQGRGIKFYNNIIENVSDPLWGDIVQGVSIYSGSPEPNNMQFYNNLFINNFQAGLELNGNSEEFNIINNSFLNNIFYNNGRLANGNIYGRGPITNENGFQLIIQDKNKVLNNFYKNNLFYSSGFSDLIYYGHDPTDSYSKTVDEFNLMNGNSGDIIIGNKDSNPLFDEPLNKDYKLNYLSPLIDSGFNNERKYDILGNPIYGIPDIGPFEYQPPYLIGNDKLYNNSSIRIYSDGKFRYLSQNSIINDIDFSITPDNGFYHGDYSFLIDILNISFDQSKEFSINSSKSFSILFKIGNLNNQVNYRILVDGTSSSYVTSSSCNNNICTINNGYLIFRYNGDNKNHRFRIEAI